MKAALVLAGLVRVAQADCAPQAAVKVLTGATFVEFRKVNTLSSPAIARNVAVVDGLVRLGDRRIELANLYVKTEHHDFAKDAQAKLAELEIQRAAQRGRLQLCHQPHDDRAKHPIRNDRLTPECRDNPLAKGCS